MDTTIATGEGRDVTGKVKETVGNAIGDRELSREGLADQLGGKSQKAIGSARAFARERPFATAALAGVIGIALLNTLRGK